jgi:hypothetical protein
MATPSDTRVVNFDTAFPVEDGASATQRCLQRMKELQRVVLSQPRSVGHDQFIEYCRLLSSLVHVLKERAASGKSVRTREPLRFYHSITGTGCDCIWYELIRRSIDCARVFLVDVADIERAGQVDVGRRRELHRCARDLIGVLRFVTEVAFLEWSRGMVVAKLTDTPYTNTDAECLLDVVRAYAIWNWTLLQLDEESTQPPVLQQALVHAQRLIAARTLLANSGLARQTTVRLNNNVMYGEIENACADRTPDWDVPASSDSTAVPTTRVCSVVHSCVPRRNVHWTARLDAMVWLQAGAYFRLRANVSSAVACLRVAHAHYCPELPCLVAYEFTYRQVADRDPMPVKAVAVLEGIPAWTRQPCLPRALPFPQTSSSSLSFRSE